uniref:Variant surface glycoprotein WRATAT B n=1 Tax=Trypanosoma brucei rhodesiense TaxID=31286 RepID=VSWB_TRYBR|nr:RecName: Full=Variant surface glycoprotein WRATAT B; Short=VSG; Flags: Precursor [Trypanosoma brucei rhodesiense]AAA30317.1 WRATat B variant surface glycoprotein [Trypanosoma brucei]
MWIILALLTLAGSRVAHGAGKNVNGVEFNLFCHIANMLNAEKIEDDKTDGLDRQAAEAWTAIDSIFTVTANESYYSEGPASAANTTDENQDAKPERVAKWVQKRNQIDKIAAPGNEKNGKYARRPRDRMSAATGAKLDTVFTLASEARVRLMQIDTEIATNKQEIRQQLGLHCSEGQGKGQSRNQHPDNAAFASDYSTACKGSTGPGKSLANDLVCICSTDTSQAQSTLQMCTSIDDANSLFSTLHKRSQCQGDFPCPHRVCAKTAETSELTETNINNCVTAFTATLGRHTKSSATNEGAYVFGSGQNSGDECNGGAATGQSCVSYHDLITAKSGTTLSGAITRLKQLQIAKAKLKARRLLLQNRERQQTRLMALADKMQELYQEALHDEVQLRKEAQNKPQETPDSDKQKACEKYHNKSKECKENGCQWSGTEETIGKCEAKPKAGTEAATTGPGERDAGATANTTGSSNSFVIKTSPLLFAFLLF